MITGSWAYVIGLLPILWGFFMSAWYIRETLVHHIRPHAFTWLIWSITTGIAFGGQVTSGGGLGAWFLGYSTVGCVVTTLLGFWKGDRRYSRFDWVTLLVALVAIVPWYATSDPTASVILATFIDACGYLPTMRKILRDPKQESLLLFVTANLQYLCSLLVMERYVLNTLLFPVVACVMNVIVVGMLLVGRAKKS